MQSQILLPWVALPVQSLGLLTSIIQSKMCSEDCSVLEMVNSRLVLLSCILLSGAGWLSCVLLVFLFFFFLCVLDLGQGFMERDVPHAVPSCCYPTKLIKERGVDEGQESSLYLTPLCSASGEFCGITSAGKVCKQSICLQGLKGVCQISNIHGISGKWYQVVGATRV